MRQPVVMEHPQGSGLLELAHEFHLMPCCPVSKNPRPGSTITVSYRPAGYKLEVGALYAYLHQYRGGLKDDAGVLLVRDMEGMVERIAQECAAVLLVDVQVRARLILVPHQVMHACAVGHPPVRQSA